MDFNNFSQIFAKAMARAEERKGREATKALYEAFNDVLGKKPKTASQEKYVLRVVRYPATDAAPARVFLTVGLQDVSPEQVGLFLQDDLLTIGIGSARKKAKVAAGTVTSHITATVIQGNLVVRIERSDLPGTATGVIGIAFR